MTTPTDPVLDGEVRKVIYGLMLADNLGDVHEEIDQLRRAVDLPDLEGDFVTGWTDADWEGIDDEEEP